MIAAVAVSGLFLACYLVYHATSPIFQFPGPAAHKPWYYALLISHVVLAAAAVPVIAVTLGRAWKERFEAHRRLARWTFPLWVYVAGSGVAVYWLLYHTYR
jgi:putative membrane protein